MVYEDYIERRVGERRELARVPASLVTEAYSGLAALKQQTGDYANTANTLPEVSLFAGADDLPLSSAGRMSEQSGSGSQSDMPMQKGDPDTPQLDEEPGNYDEFPYQMIFRNVQPEQHTITNGETVEDLARRHLGPGATDEQVRAHVQEIRDINTASSFGAGEQIVMPGHTENGDVVMPLKDGSTYTISGDPVERAREVARLEEEYRKPPVVQDQSSPAPAPEAANQGCYEVRIDYEYAERHSGRTVLRPVRIREWRCPGQQR